jgi:hypothetical protein
MTQNTLPRLVEDRDFTFVVFVFADEPVTVNVSRLMKGKVSEFNVVEKAAFEAYCQLLNHNCMM